MGIVSTAAPPGQEVETQASHNSYIVADQERAYMPALGVFQAHHPSNTVIQLRNVLDCDQLRLLETGDEQDPLRCHQAL